MWFAYHRMRRAGIDADFREQFFRFVFNLIPKPVDPQERRLVAYRATFAAQDGLPVFAPEPFR